MKKTRGRLKLTEPPRKTSKATVVRVKRKPPAPPKLKEPKYLRTALHVGILYDNTSGTLKDRDVSLLSGSAFSATSDGYGDNNGLMAEDFVQTGVAVLTATSRAKLIKTLLESLGECISRQCFFADDIDHYPDDEDPPQTYELTFDELVSFELDQIGRLRHRLNLKAHTGDDDWMLNWTVQCDTLEELLLPQGLNT